MGLKSGFGGAGDMNGPKTAKNNRGSAKAGFGRAKTGPKGGVGGYSGGKWPGNPTTVRGRKK